MGKVYFQRDPEAIRQLLIGEEMQGIVAEYAAQKAAEAGEGYEYSVSVAPTRCLANIYPATKEAWKDNLDNNTLEKIIRVSE